MPDGAEVARASDVNGMLDALATVPAEALQLPRAAARLLELADGAHRVRHGDRAARAAGVGLRHDGGDARLPHRDAVAGSRPRSGAARWRTSTPPASTPSTEFVRIGGGLAWAARAAGWHSCTSCSAGATWTTSSTDVRIFVPHVGGRGHRRRSTGSSRTTICCAFALRMRRRSGDPAAVPGRAAAAEDLMADLAAYLSAMCGTPIAVRSSSLLEDSQLLPAAGIYPTHMLPNSTVTNLMARLDDLRSAIKHVYASTFFRGAKAYLASTANLVEDEKMAVVIQQVVGRRHGDVVYPDMAGTASSYNFYPVRDMRPEDGVANVALGLGKTVVEGGRTVRFSPAHRRVAAAVLHAGRHPRERAARVPGAGPDAAPRLPRARARREHGEPGPGRRRASRHAVAGRVDVLARERRGLRRAVAAGRARRHDGADAEAQRLSPCRDRADAAGSGQSGHVRARRDRVRGRPAPRRRRDAALRVAADPSAWGAEACGSAVSLSDFDPEDVFVRSAHTLGAGRNDGMQDIVVGADGDVRARADASDRGRHRRASTSKLRAQRNDRTCSSARAVGAHRTVGSAYR